MKTKIIFLAVITMLFFFTNCEKETLWDHSESNINLSEDIHTSAIGIHKLVPIIGEIYIGVDAYNEFGLGTRGKIQGKFSHLGKLNETSSWENESYDLDPFPIIEYVNSISFSAANGDLLSGTFYGTLDLISGKSNGTMVFEEGTGRFTQVSGAIYGEGFADFDPGSGLLTGLSLKGAGEISYKH